MSAASAVELLVLHGVRLKGVAEPAAVAKRFGIEQAMVGELLLDAQAVGWVSWSEFAGSGGWSLTDAGRAENERQLKGELDGIAGGSGSVRAAYEGFMPLNGRLQKACTDWQLRPTDEDKFAFNDHRDLEWDKRVIAELHELEQALGPIADQLTAVLDRFEGYDARFSNALGKARDGQAVWVDGTSVDSCHTVWFELHEDLIATLGLRRGE